jgi:hypothetical protein
MGIPPFYTEYSLKHAGIRKLVRSKIELSKINKMARFTLNSIIVLGYYSLTASNKEVIATLIEKDVIKPQKEKFEENIKVAQEDLDYDREYKEIFKDELLRCIKISFLSFS